MPSIVSRVASRRPQHPAWPTLGWLALGLTLVCLDTGVVSAAAFKLSASGNSESTVPTLEVSPDGRWAAWVQNALVSSGHELWAREIDSDAAPEVLGAHLPANGRVTRIAISSDSQRVVYLEEHTGSPTQREIWSVRFDTGVRTKLNPSLPLGALVTSFAITPDGSRVIYRADQQVAGTFHLWTVPIGGGPSVRLAPAGFAGGSWARDNTWSISPNGTHVAYLANYLDLGKVELFSAPTDGSVLATRISGPLVAGGNVQDFEFRPSGTHVVYRADQDIDNVNELFRAPIGGGTVLKLNPNFSASMSVLSYAISPSGSRLVYRADAITDNVWELFSVTLLGGSVTKLNPTLVPGGDVGAFAITAGSDYVVYEANQDTHSIRELYSVPIAGGTSLKLHSPITVLDTRSNGFWISPTGHRIVYRLMHTDWTDHELFSVDVRLGPASSHQLWPWWPDPDSRAQHILISSDAQWVFYEANHPTSGLYHLYASPMESLAAPIHISSPAVPGSRVGGNRRLHPDDRRIVFRGDLEVPGRQDIFIGDLCLFCDGFETASTSRW